MRCIRILPFFAGARICIDVAASLPPPPLQRSAKAQAWQERGHARAVEQRFGFNLRNGLVFSSTVRNVLCAGKWGWGAAVGGLNWDSVLVRSQPSHTPKKIECRSVLYSVCVQMPARSRRGILPIQYYRVSASKSIAVFVRALKGLNF